MGQRILILGTYPIDQAIHGGQKRTRAIIAKYKAMGHEVRYVSICTPGNYSRYLATDIRVNDTIMGALHTLPSPTFTELIICREAAKDDGIIEKVKNIIERFNPTIVQYEQGYCYEFTRTIGDRLGISDKPVVFSSHNVEWKMKRDIALAEGCSSGEIEQYVSLIKDIETQLVGTARYTIAVSDTDAEEYGSYKKQGGEILVAQNGIDPLRPTQAAEHHWQKLYRKENIKKTIVFVASAHPPNLQGFRTLVDGVGFLPFSARIIVAGGVSDMLKNLAKGSYDIQLATLSNRVLLVGKLSEQRLQGLISTADVLMLPILDGGGSNLKTAEALVAGKPIVATSYAYRSYEEYMSRPDTYIADTPVDFQAAILEALRKVPQQAGRGNNPPIDAVLWSSRLNVLEKMTLEEEMR